jgi:flagellar biosynthesis chaperone FliJ
MASMNRYDERNPLVNAKAKAGGEVSIQREKVKHLEDEEQKYRAEVEDCKTRLGISPNTLEYAQDLEAHEDILARTKRKLAVERDALEKKQESLRHAEAAFDKIFGPPE